MALIIRVQSEAFDPGAELSAFAATAGDACGAVASFLGQVRGGAAEALTLEHYPGFTEAEIERIAAEIAARFSVEHLLALHRYGQLSPGEPIVMAAAASAHRKAAFEAAMCLMDFLKTDAPFWKRETRADGAHWIEPRAEDRAARKAWESEHG